MTALVLAGFMMLAQGPSAPPPAAPPLSGTISREQAAAALAKCGSRRFETSAEGLIDGKVRRTRLDLCATEADSPADWIAKLERSAASVEAQGALPANVKTKLIGDLRREIARLKSEQSILPVRADIGGGLVGRTLQPKSDFAVSALPPMPPRTATTGVTRVVGATPGPAAVPSKSPRVSIKCVAPGMSPATCGYMGADEAFVIEAEETLESAVTLRFRRAKGDRQAEVPLGRLRSGQAVRLAVPKVMCAGVVRARFDVEIVGPGSGGVRYFDTRGPFERHC